MRNVTGDVNDAMPGSDGLRILGDFWKKGVSWDSDSGPGSPEELRFEAGRSELRSEPRRVQLGLGGALRVVGSDGTVSIVEIVCVSLSLSPRVENLKVKKVIKVSYLN